MLAKINLPSLIDNPEVLPIGTFSTQFSKNHRHLCSAAYSRQNHQKWLLRPALAELVFVSSSLAYVEGEALNAGTGVTASVLSFSFNTAYVSTKKFSEI